MGWNTRGPFGPLNFSHVLTESPQTSTATGSAAAVLALVAAAIRRHQHTAFGARGGAVPEGVLAVEDHLVARSAIVNLRRLRRRGHRGGRRGSLDGRLRQIIGRDESSSEPPADVIQHRFRVGNFLVAGITGRL